MLPLNDTEPNRYSIFPFMTLVLILINTAIMIWELSLPSEMLRAVFWVFGRRVEDACGPLRFLLYYLMAGTTAGLLTTAIQPDMEIPGIGASGAISGIMGAYLMLFPAGRIRTLVFIFIVPTWPRIRAAWFLLYYLIIQIPPAIDIYLNGANYGIGYWAHLGGFFACFFVLLFLRPEAFARYLSDVPV